jgi:LuxR family quorum sensing-dependent transcriptional regulator
VCQQLLKVSSQFGLQGLIAGTMPRPNDIPSERQEQNVFLRGWPTGWLERYIGRNYVFIDPIIARIQSDLTPFTWDQAPIDPEKSSIASTMLGEAREFGLNAGFAVPLITLEGDIASVSLGGERMELPPRAKGMLSLISTYAMGRAIQLKNNRLGAVYRPLTSREIEAMRWAADGKTEWEISVIMSISEHTAAKHLNNARGKLGAVNRVQAIANAIRSGIIR